MAWTFQQFVTFLMRSKKGELLKSSRHGLEKECLRVDPKGQISLKQHPETWGSALEHPWISTDFSEAQPEFRTPPFDTESQAWTFLKRVEAYAAQNLSKELFWPSSAPAILPSEKDIPIADYGSSAVGLSKRIYRNGLSYRYGRKMQMLSGIHYNFSLDPEIWSVLQGRFGDSEDLQDFQSAGYMAMARNFLRYGWITTYLYGATPALDRSYVDRPQSPLRRLDNETYYAPYATSVRMSRFGYYSRTQVQLPISFNSLEDYLKGLEYAVSTPNSSFEKIGTYRNGQARQLNAYHLQLEAEHYSRVRPKGVPDVGSRPINALRKHGVQYLEIRAIDLDPTDLLGISVEQLRFYHVLLLTCLAKPSAAFSRREMQELTRNQELVAMYGRDPSLKLKRDGRSILMRDWALELLEEMRSVARLLDHQKGGGLYEAAVDRAIRAVKDPEQTPSGRVLRKLREGSSFRGLHLQMARKMMNALQSEKLSDAFVKKMQRVGEESIEKQREREWRDDFILEGYEDLEPSTQMVMREAFKRGIEVEILDRKDNFLRLSRGRKCEYVKQATKTSRDSYMTYLLMENKVVTKRVLEDYGLSVPRGGLYYDLQSGLADYDRYADRKLVVKPNFTNFGDGIVFVDPGDRERYEEGLKIGFSHGSEVVVENFIEGLEYRILVIDGRVSAIVHRIPACVDGDGELTVRELIREKNSDPDAYKWPTYRIRTGKEEARMLELQGMDFDTVPEKGARIWLRENSNVSTGGDPIDMTGQLHKGYERIALEAAEAVESTFCGVDLMILDPKARPKADNYSIIEINFNPCLFIHRYVVEGEGRRVECDVLDALGF